MTRSLRGVEYEYMKKITAVIFGTMFIFGAFTTASAQVYTYGSQQSSHYYSCGTYGSYGCSYQNYQQSYYFTQGCYTYYYNAYTKTSQAVSYNCQTNTYYTQPVTYTYYTSPYYTYQYQEGTWYPSYNNNHLYEYNNWNTNWNNGFVSTPTVNCYYYNNQRICQ